MTRLPFIALALLVPSLGAAQGIPAVSGVLETEVRAKVPRGMPPTLTLRVPDRPAAFYARCTFGSPEQEAVAESDVVEAGEAFVLALPADTDARTAECAVVARFANGLSERKPVSMAWQVVEPEPEVEPEAAPDDPPKDDEKTPDDAPKDDQAEK